MNIKDAAAALNGMEYASEDKELFAQMKAAGLVAVFGDSDDLMEFRGAIHDELGAYNGTTARVTPKGLLEACDCECVHYQRAAEASTEIRAIWDDGGFSWRYETKIPHEKFVIYEDGEPYCEGIVFALAEVAA